MSFLGEWVYNLLLVLLAAVLVTALLGGLGLLPPNTAGAAATKWRGKGEVNVLLGVKADHERGDVDDLLSNTTIHDSDIRFFV